MRTSPRINPDLLPIDIIPGPDDQQALRIGNHSQLYCVGAEFSQRREFVPEYATITSLHYPLARNGIRLVQDYRWNPSLSVSENERKLQQADGRDEGHELPESFRAYLLNAAGKELENVAPWVAVHRGDRLGATLGEGLFQRQIASILATVVEPMAHGSQLEAESRLTARAAS